MSPNPSTRATTRRSRKSIATIPNSHIPSDKENSTIHGFSSYKRSALKKSRSKSLGLGELEALSETAGNAQKAPIVPRSILKPSIPLSPLRPIPQHPNLRKSSPSKEAASQPPTRNSPSKNLRSAQQSGSDSVFNPFNGNDNLSTEASQEPSQIASKSQEDEEVAAARELEKKRAIERRDARRKSLANRRVSFAPEATLHTWDFVELSEDATSSSEATNSTRRASNALGTSRSPFAQQENPPSSDLVESLSGPPDTGIQVVESPARQTDSHQKKKRRRSSGIPPMNFGNPNDFSSSPMSSAGSEDGSFITAEDEIVEASDSDSDNDLVVREETITNIDNDDTTMNSLEEVGSNHVDKSQSPNGAELAAPHDDTIDEDGDMSMEMATGEVTYAFKPWAKKMEVNPNPPEPTNDEEMTMEVTQAVGGILPNPLQSRTHISSKRKSLAAKRKSIGRKSLILPGDDDQTMDLTIAVGGIQNGTVDVADEDMSMEFTSVIGGVVNQALDLAATPEKIDRQIEQVSYPSLDSEAADGDMDMTVPMGGILTPVTERTEPSEGETGVMDITTAIGSILPKDLQTEDKLQAKVLMEEEVNRGQLTESPFKKPGPKGQSKTTPVRVSTKASEYGSPGLVGVQTRSSRRSLEKTLSISPARRSQPDLADVKAQTPSKQLTPRPRKPATPSKTPPKKVSLGEPSPKRLFGPEAKTVEPSPKKQSVTTPPAEKPLVGKLSPRTRRRPISPIVHTHIPFSNSLFTAKSKLVALFEALRKEKEASHTAISFNNNRLQSTPVKLEPKIEELYRQNTSRLREESSVESSPDQDEQKDGTKSLRDMIEGMTPRKKKLRGITSETAKTILGKRSAEIAEFDEELRSGTSLKTNFDTPLSDSVATEGDRMTLQEFLDMVGIDFIEVNTTDRRNVEILNPRNAGLRSETITPAGNRSTAVISGLFTAPMADYYQFACNLLQDHITEGQYNIRKIEAKVYEDKPPLIEEYMALDTSERKTIADQLKLWKIYFRHHAQLTRAQLEIELFKGILGHYEEVNEALMTDEKLIAQQENIINSVGDRLKEKYSALSSEVFTLQSQVDALANCDQEELKATRESLISVEAEIEARKLQVDEMQATIAQQESSIEYSKERKETLLNEIEESERELEECRGWSLSEVSVLKAKVNAIEEETGWTITTAHGHSITMQYNKELSLSVTPAAFAPYASPELSNASISLSCVDHDKQELGTVRRFFLQTLQARLLSIHQSQTELYQVLDLVRNGWKCCTEVINQVNLLEAAHITEPSIIDDEKLNINAVLLLRNLRSKLDIGFTVSWSDFNNNARTALNVNARTVYGKELSEEKLSGFLQKRVSVKEAKWSDAIGALVARLEGGENLQS